MPMPTTYEECAQRARSIAIDTIREWAENDRHSDFTKDDFLDVYTHELKVLLDLMGDRNGNIVDRSARELVGHCHRMRVLIGKNSPIGIAVDAVIKACASEVSGKPDLARQEVSASLFRNLFLSWATNQPLQLAVVCLLKAADSEPKPNTIPNVTQVLNALAEVYGADHVRELISEMA
jgi:hypothetical protein